MVPQALSNLVWTTKSSWDKKFLHKDIENFHRIKLPTSRITVKHLLL